MMKDEKEMMRFAGNAFAGMSAGVVNISFRLSLDKAIEVITFVKKLTEGEDEKIDT